MVSRRIQKFSPMVCIIIVASITIIVSIIAPPVQSLSSNLCSTCHGSAYNQQLDILEGNSQNIIPTTIQVDQAQMVKVTIENINDAPRYNQFNSVAITLSSQYGHFSVETPTVNIGTLSTTTTATWEITGMSQGSDTLLISASATNTHFSLRYSDNYSPNPTITVTIDPASTSTPTSTTTQTPTTVSPNPTSSSTTTPQPTSKPTNSPTSSQKQTPQPTKPSKSLTHPKSKH